MKQSLSWRTAAKIALRDLSASRTKFIFIAFAIAAGVGSLAGVRGFGREFRAMLGAEARTLMAADLSVRVFERATDNQIAVLDSIVKRGAKRTEVTETISMLSSERTEAPMLVSVKAVDPELYPFYGELKLDPPMTLRQALKPDTVAVADDAMIRAGLKTGDMVFVGEAQFRIAAVLKTEPDRMVGNFTAGPRVLLSRAALDRTGLIKPGSRAADRHLFRLDSAKFDLDATREELKAAFPSAQVADYRETHPSITRGLDRSENFLSLVSLIAVIIGSLGVAATMHSHLRQRMDTIAIMKCIGARSGQVIGIYVLQTAAIGLLGGLIGCVAGVAIQAAFPLLIARFFSLTPAFRLDPRPAVEALSIGMLSALLFTWPALLEIEKIRPLALFRRDMARDGEGIHKKAWAARGIILVALGALAAWVSDFRTGLYFAGGLLVSLLLLAGFAWLLLFVLRKSSRRGWGLSARHGIANIYRPGNQAQSVLVSLGIGVMFTMTIYLVQHGMIGQILEGAPPNMPNIFLINITSRERAGVDELVRGLKGLRGTPEIVPTIAVRLQRELPPRSRFRQARAVTSWPQARPNSRLVEGQWWTPANARPNEVCVLEETAKELKIRTGEELTWKAGLETIRANVVCIYHTEEVRIGGNMDFIFSPGTLDRLPVQYFGALRMSPSAVPAFEKQSFERFPSVTVINAADVIEIIQQVVDQIALVVRFISFFAIVAGAIILASSVAATRFRRVREVAILRTLGASRSRVAKIFSVEFFVLGSVAGLLGALLATGFSNLLLVRVFQAKSRIDILAIGAAVVITAAIANLAGWLASVRILGQKPLEVLRNE